MTLLVHTPQQVGFLYSGVMYNVASGILFTMKWLQALLILSALSVLPADEISALEITGSARVVDGDTIAIGAQLIRLHGIDAPENGQDCMNASGKRYNCGNTAEKALRSMLTGKVSCIGDARDSYERLIAVCSSGGVEINRAMVRSGWALAFRKFSDDYAADEKAANDARRGLWAGTFALPWEWRAEKWSSAVQEVPDSECPIKGNINSKGDRIYHAPWSRSYKRTRINTAKGERWFCSEADALAAGWRAPFR